MSYLLIKFAYKPICVNIRVIVFFLSLFIAHTYSSAQTINIIRFNNTASYYPGGSISIHINPTGLFAIDNAFYLDLSDANGNFAPTPNVIATVNEFFTPVINAIIPSGTPVGTGFKLRVRASTAGAVSATSNSFSVVGAPNPTLVLPEISLSGVPLAQITCSTPTQNIPYLGWLNQSSGATTTSRTLLIANSSGSETYTATLVDMSSGSASINPLAVAGNQITFPAGRPTYYYVLEVERRKNISSESTIRSFIFHFNTGLTNLGNSSSETVCINSSVLFNIDLDNIKNNYPGSKYIITYGDGSPSETYTHAQLTSSPSLSHIFTAPTCSSPDATQNGANGYFFKVDIKLQNKGIGTGNCNTYVDNGNGTTKWVNSSKPPIANFSSPQNKCINTSLAVTNTSTFGSYGTGATCETNMYTVWKVKKPGQTNFEIVSEGPGRLDYTFPASDVNVAGCWIVRLEVSNLEGCLTVSSIEKTIGIEPVPSPNFKIIKGGVEVNTICNGETVTLTDNSILVGVQCQNPAYAWGITPSTGFTYAGGTSSSSQNPQVTFNTPGVYTITQSITNSCGTYTAQKTLTVNGAPTVAAPPVTNPICKFSPADTVLDFSVVPLKPAYSTGNYAPTSYSWQVNGSSTPNADWEFVGGTSSSSEFPKIKLKTYRTYTIKITVDGSCGNGSATYSFELRQKPKITNTLLEQRLCSGSTSQSFDLTSDMASTNFSWTTAISPAGSVTGITGQTSGTSIPGTVLTNNTSVVGTVTFAVSATNNGCSNVQDFKVFVHPKPPKPVVSSPVTYCQGETPVALTATGSTGNTLLWYTTATGGTSSTTAPTPSTSNAGTTSYYVSQTTDNNPLACEGSRSELQVIVKPKPNITVTPTDPTSCVPANGKIEITGLAASASYVLTYTYNGSAQPSQTLTSSASGSILLTGLAGGSYTSIVLTLNGCASDPKSVTLVNPSSPTGNAAGSNGPLCTGQTLNLSGSSSTSGVSYQWSGPNGFTSTQQNPSIANVTTAVGGTYNLIVSVNGCSAPAVSVSVVIRQTPGVPVVSSPVTYCQGETPVALTATGSTGNTLLWYTTATGGTSSTTAPTPSTSNAGTTSYYVSQTTDNNPLACEGSRSELQVIVKPTPAITATSTNPTNCTNPDGTIVISGLDNNITYQVAYTNPLGQQQTPSFTSSAIGAITIPSLGPGTYSNITVSLSGCTSNIIGPFTLLNPSSPVNVTITTNAPICSGQTLTLTATSLTAGATFAWTGPAFPNGANGAIQTVSSASTTASGIYSVVATVVGCNAQPVNQLITVYATPTAPTAQSPISYCQNDVAIALTATADPGNTLTWYPGGLPNLIPSTATIGTTTYYVEQSTPTSPPCVSPRTPVVVNVFEIPVITGSFTNPTNCITPDGTITINGLNINTQYTVSYSFNGSPLTTSQPTSNGSGTIVLASLPAGSYTNITVALNGCKSSPLSFTLTNPAAPANTTITTNAPICSGNTLTLQASSNTVGATFSWTGPAFATATTGASHSFPAAPSTYSGTYTVIASIFGCPAPPVTKDVVVHLTPLAPVSLSRVEYCHNEPPTVLSAIATGSNILNWYLPPTYPAPGTPNAPTPSTATVGTTIYYVTQISPTIPACESPRTQIEVVVKPIPQIAVSAMAPSTCNSNNGAMTITGLFPNTSYQVHYIVNSVVVNTSVNSNTSGNIFINNLVGGIYRDIWVILNGCRSNVVAGPFNLVNPDVPATPDASSNSPICEGATLQLNAVSLTPNVTYEWTGPNGYTSSLSNPQIVNATINRTGRYKVVAQANGCVSEPDSIDVIVHPNPIVNLGPDLQLLPPAQQVLNPIITNGPISQYTWTPNQNLSCSNCPSPTATVLSSITYQLAVRNNNGCVGRDDIHITALCERSLVYIPNAFVPNGGANSVFRIRSAGSLVVKHFRIFNRWGELIFERTNFPTNDIAYGWDGRINGTLINPDVFVYSAEVQCENGAIFTFKGNVTLLR